MDVLYGTETPFKTTLCYLTILDFETPLRPHNFFVASKMNFEHKNIGSCYNRIIMNNQRGGNEIGNHTVTRNIFSALYN